VFGPNQGVLATEELAQFQQNGVGVISVKLVDSKVLRKFLVTGSLSAYFPFL